MHTLRVALAQINTTVGDFEGNATRILEAAREAAALEADVVAFPELAITGYPPEDLLIRDAFIEDARIALERLAEDAKDLPPLVVGCVEYRHQLYNAAAVLHGGGVAGMYRKHSLPNYGVFDEHRYFQAGTETPLFAIAGVEVGITVCEDIWYPGGPMRAQALGGASVILNINASPFHAGKSVARERMLQTRASDNGVAICYVNQVGGQDELVFDGNSFVVGPRGEVVARGASMREDLLVVDIPVTEIRQAQLHDPRLRREREGIAAIEPILVTPGAPPARAPIPPRLDEPADPTAEVYDALVLGTGDYLRKTGFTDALVALSGGIDSAIVAAIAVDAIGAEHVRGVAMPSRYSSEGSLADARALADLLGIELVTLPIEPMHQAALDTLAREFEGTTPGVAEENVQSRIRGALVMALSNKTGAIVLTTGNKSEYACGYATLYGDMVGGFAVIKDVPKTLVYKLANHRNARGLVIPQATIDKPPSAELRPDQLDTDSLPPYDVLDPIIEAYVEDDRPVEAIVADGFEEATVRRVVDLINRNEYKRRQSPPGVKVTTRAFGRDRRLPLASRYRPY
ncbi:MAG: NAD+ synthase [Dehalococcoidia bacterium]